MRSRNLHARRKQTEVAMAKIDDQASFGGALSKASVFRTLFGAKTGNAEAREAAEIPAHKTSKQREMKRGRERSKPISFRCKPSVGQMLDELAECMGLSKTDVFELAIRELASRRQDGAAPNE